MPQKYLIFHWFHRGVPLIPSALGQESPRSVGIPMVSQRCASNWISLSLGEFPMDMLWPQECSKTIGKPVFLLRCASDWISWGLEEFPLVLLCAQGCFRNVDIPWVSQRCASNSISLGSGILQKCCCPFGFTDVCLYLDQFNIENHW